MQVHRADVRLVRDDDVQQQVHRRSH
jgi:hypothetical protein